MSNDISKARDAVTYNLQERLRRATNLIAQVEWSMPSVTDRHLHCPYCGAKEKHVKDCELDHFLLEEHSPRLKQHSAEDRARYWESKWEEERLERFELQTELTKIREENSND